MRVVLVDDHPLFLEGLKNWLISNDIQVVGTAANVWDALREVKEYQPDLVLMDVQMANFDGIEATRMIKNRFPETKVIMLTISDADEHLFEAVRAGASGYLLKSLTPADFLDCLSRAAKGENPFSPGLSERVLAEFSRLVKAEDMKRPNKARITGTELTERQTEILALMAQGLIYKEIGYRLHLAEATIKYHVKEMMGRVGAERRQQLIAYAAQNGWIDKTSLKVSRRLV